MKISLSFSGFVGGVVLAALAVFPPRFASAQILMSSGAYSQNFDSLAQTNAWWTNNITIPGWYASRSATDLTNTLAGTGGSNAGGVYSFGTNGINPDSDRALGSIASSSTGSLGYGVRFINDTGLAVSNVIVSYTGEQWRNGGNTSTQTLQFAYCVSDSPITNAISRTIFTNFTALNFNSPTTGSATAALDGNDPANRQTFSNVDLTGVTVLPGQELFLRWLDTDDSGFDHALAIDDLTVSFQAATNSTASNPPVILTQPANATATAGDTVSFSVTVSGTAPLSYEWKSNSIPVSGETNDTLTLNNVATNMSGSVFSVAITNAFGATNSTGAILTVSAAQAGFAADTAARILRVVTYNIEADITLTNEQPTFTNVVIKPGAPLPGLIAPPTDTNNFAAGGVLAGIGEEVVNGNAQPIDVLALQETTSNTSTVAPIVNALNTFYGVPGLYSNSLYQATESGNFPGSGNGPNAIIYNRRTVQLLASVPVDPPGGTSQLGSSSGEYREVMRYQFAPAGVASNANNTFYIYVSHYKSGTGSSNANYRNGEATIVRNDMATLSPAAHILHVGDFNTGDASEAMYATLVAPGTNQLLDPLNPGFSLTTNFDNSSTPINLTDAATGLRYRDDYQMMTTNVYYGAGDGLALVPGSFHCFANNGSTAYFGSVNSGANTSLNNRLATNGPAFISAAQLYVDLTGASDHLPVVADYTIPVPAPKITGITPAGNNFAINVTNAMTNAVYTLLTSTNLIAPLANWTPLATNTAVAGSLIITVTNTSGPAKFFRVKTR